MQENVTVIIGRTHIIFMAITKCRKQDISDQSMQHKFFLLLTQAFPDLFNIKTGVTYSVFSMAGLIGVLL
jgi:hypothetical protein